MVIQRNAAYPVWGWADPGEKVAVTFNGRTGSAVARAGQRLEGDAFSHEGGRTVDMTIRGKNSIVLRNILVGDVWVWPGSRIWNGR